MSAEQQRNNEHAPKRARPAKTRVIQVSLALTVTGTGLAAATLWNNDKPDRVQAELQPSVQVNPTVTQNPVLNVHFSPTINAQGTTQEGSAPRAAEPATGSEAIPSPSSAPAAFPSLCIGLKPLLNVEKVTVRFVKDQYSYASYEMSLVVRSLRPSGVAVGWSSWPKLVDEEGNVLNSARRNFPQITNYDPGERFAEGHLASGFKVAGEEPTVLTYTFVSAKHRGKKVSLSDRLVLAYEKDGRPSITQAAISCDELPVL